MNDLAFKEKFKVMITIANEYIENVVIENASYENTIYKAMRYSLLAGGKRLRPVLALAVCELLEGSREDVLPFAAAIELIHTYSLIHDDLPCMDNDDFRRGKPTNHKVFGEAIAVLAGDALLNKAFEHMLSNLNFTSSNLNEKVKAMNIIANAAGSKGMIAGQVVDIESENKSIDYETLKYMHKCKTGALIKAPVLASAVICSTNEDEIRALELFSEKIGLAFQIKDDILDVEGTNEKLGKPVGSDQANNKSTFVSLFGINKSKEMLQDVTLEAINALKLFGEKADFLINLAGYLVSREN